MSDIENSDLVSKAKTFARKAHKGQVDDDGIEYFEAHLSHVAKIISSAGGSVEMVAAAYLHDTLEDTATTVDVLIMEFGERVAGLVQELTHDGKADNVGFYFPRLVSRDAIVIKFADRMSNLLRMASWPESRKNQYLKRSRFWRVWNSHE